MKRRNGFTLVEILSMVAIVVLLVSIFLPSVNNIERQSNSVCCQYNPRNDIIFSPIELVLISPDGISGKLTIVGKFLAWEQISENPDPSGSYVSNLWVCDNWCISDTCRISHNFINQSEDNSKWILTDSSVNEMEQKQSAR